MFGLERSITLEFLLRIANSQPPERSRDFLPVFTAASGHSSSRSSNARNEITANPFGISCVGLFLLTIMLAASQFFLLGSPGRTQHALRRSISEYRDARRRLASGGQEPEGLRQFQPGPIVLSRQHSCGHPGPYLRFPGLEGNPQKRNATSRPTAGAFGHGVGFDRKPGKRIPSTLRVSRVQRASQRAGMGRQLGQMGMAMHNYYATYGRFPPAAVCGTDGKPLLSWRVLLLPFRRTNCTNSSSWTSLGTVPTIFDCTGKCRSYMAHTEESLPRME